MEEPYLSTVVSSALGKVFSKTQASVGLPAARRSPASEATKVSTAGEENRREAGRRFVHGAGGGRAAARGGGDSSDSSDSSNGSIFSARRVVVRLQSSISRALSGQESLSPT